MGVRARRMIATGRHHRPTFNPDYDLGGMITVRMIAVGRNRPRLNPDFNPDHDRDLTQIGTNSEVHLKIGW
jgi:hypothetical protein